MTYALTMLGRWRRGARPLRRDARGGARPHDDLSSVLSGTARDPRPARTSSQEARQLLARWEELGRSADLYEAVACDAGDRRGAPRPKAIAADALAVAEKRPSRDAKPLGIAQPGREARVACVPSRLPSRSRTGARRRKLLALVERAPGRTSSAVPHCQCVIASALVSPPTTLPPTVTSRRRPQSCGRSSCSSTSRSFCWSTANGCCAQAGPDDAAPLLAEARETFERLEAAPWLARVDGLLPAGREPEPVPAG